MKKISFKMLYETYYKDVYKSTLTIVQDEALAKDATQEAFIVVYKKFDQLKDINNIKNFIITIATRKAIDMNRKESKTFCTDKVDIMFKDTETPFDIVSNKEVQILLYHALEQLDFRYRQVILLKYYNNLSNKKIGRILMIPEGTVKSRLNKAKKLLRAKLKPLYDSEVCYDEK